MASLKGNRVQDPTTSASEVRSTGTRLVGFGLAAIVIILLLAAILLFYNLPDANAFNQRVEDIFTSNDGLTEQSEIKLLEIQNVTFLRFRIK